MHKKRLATATAVAVLVVGGGTAAYAYWSTSGTGTGTATTAPGTANLTVTQVSAPTNLAPGVAAGGITITVKNNATNDVHLSAATASISSVSAAGCTAGDYTLSPSFTTYDAGAGATAFPVGGINVPAGATVTFTGATLGFNNNPSVDQSACKGATVNLGYAVS